MKSIPISACPARALTLVLIMTLTAVPTAPAYLSDIAAFVLSVGESIKLKVKGSTAGAAVSLQSINTFPGGALEHDVQTFPLNGTGFVNVTVTGLTPGSGSIDFLGTNNGGFVSLSLPFIILQDPLTVAQNPHVGVAADPVSTRTGEYFGHEAVDLNLGGPMSLKFCRYVASNLTSDAMVSGRLGTNRSHNFASRIISPSGSIKQVVLPSGRVMRFDKTGTKWILKRPLDIPFQLLETSTEMLLADPFSKQIWTYDKATGRLARIQDGKGNTHTLTYTGTTLTSVSDGLGRTLNISAATPIASVAGVTGAETRTVNFGYAGGVLASVTDYGGHVTTHANSGGLPTSYTHPAGNTPFTQSYTGTRVTTQTERGTDVTGIAYGPSSTTVTDPLTHARVDNYDAQGRIISHVDETGKSIVMSYDSAGRRNSVTDRHGNKISIVYHALSGLPQTITNAEGRTVTFTYKARTLSGFVFQDLVKETYPDGASRAYAYDALGNLTQVTDEAGKNWKYTYNNRGQVLTATNPLGGVTTKTYDGAGNLITAQPPDTGVSTFAYDARHRLTLITRPGGATIAMAYDTKDRLISTTDERGKATQYAYDLNNRLITVTDPDTDAMNFGHDTLDRLTTITDKLSKVSTLSFDSRRQLASFEDRNGNTLNLSYDARQRLTGFEDGDGHDWLFTYDEEGRLASVQAPLGPPSTRKLNKLGYPTQLRDPLGNTVNLIRDAMQRVTGVVDPVGRLTSFAYDKRGMLVSATEQGTGTARYDRDALGNITRITDPNGGAWSMVYQKIGRLAKMTDPLGKSSTITYDARGRATNVTFGDASTCALSYDAANNLTSAVYSGGPSLAFTYDDHGHLASANDVIITKDKEDRIINGEQNGHDFTATYDDGGRLLTVSYFDGLFTVTYAYDDRGNLTSVTDSEGTSIALAYDNASRLTSQMRAPGIDGTYTYDAAGRLVGITEGGIITLNYELNGASEVTDLDITAPTLPGVTAGTNLFKYGKAGQIVTAGYVYDARGRLTAAPGGKTYQWDGASRLVNASGVTMTYNGVGDITTRTEAAQTTRYYHHYALGLAPIVYEDLPAGSDRVYVWTPGGRLLYSVEMGSGAPTFYHFDRQGSTLALTDAAGTVTDSYAYGPYGEPLGRTGTSTQPFTYIGAYGVRAEGGLYDMRARYYDPVSTTFLSRDPLPPRLLDPKSTNAYAYASQNPLMYIDPRGTSSHREAPGYEHAAGIDTAVLAPELLGTVNIGGGFPIVPGGFHDLNNGFPNGRRLQSDCVPPPPTDCFLGEPSTGTCGFDVWTVINNFTQTIRPPTSPGEGGGIYFGGPGLSLTGSTVTGNSSHGSDIPMLDPAQLSDVSVGGGIYTGGDLGAVIIRNSTISSNAPAASNTAIAADNTADEEQRAAIVRAVVVNQLIQLYNSFKAVEDSLKIKAQQQGFTLTEEEVRIIEEYKKMRSNLKKIIKALGGVVPK